MTDIVEFNSSGCNEELLDIIRLKQKKVHATLQPIEISQSSEIVFGLDVKGRN